MTLEGSQCQVDALGRWRHAGPHRRQAAVAAHPGLPRGLGNIAFALERQVTRLRVGEAVLAGGESEQRVLAGPGQVEPATK